VITMFALIITMLAGIWLYLVSMSGPSILGVLLLVYYAWRIEPSRPFQ
jgi:hypothetical protein